MGPEESDVPFQSEFSPFHQPQIHVSWQPTWNMCWSQYHQWQFCGRKIISLEMDSAIDHISDSTIFYDCNQSCCALLHVLLSETGLQLNVLSTWRSKPEWAKKISCRSLTSFFTFALTRCLCRLCVLFYLFSNRQKILNRGIFHWKVSLSWF